MRLSVPAHAEPAIQVIHDAANFEQFSDRSVRAAQIVVTTLPILLVYPFLQRYFIAGIRLGAVKG